MSPDASDLISHVDHLVLTVRSREATCAFYGRVLGFERVDTPGRPTALLFGNAKFNVHELGHTFEPKALAPTPGSADICLITPHPIDRVLARLLAEQVPVELGPVPRDGAKGPMVSVYFRDPDGNLVEVSTYRQV